MQDYGLDNNGLWQLGEIKSVNGFSLSGRQAGVATILVIPKMPRCDK